jgi:DNA ligase (NAD+)
MNVEEIVLRANREYYDDGLSDLSDDAYDALMEYADSKGINVSTLTPAPQSTEWPVVAHVTESDKITSTVRNVNEYRQAVERRDIGTHGVVSLKHDGLACELVYSELGALRNAILRGDGTQGEDVYANVSNIRGVPLIVPAGGLSVWGELTISENNLRVLNERREALDLPPYKTARNAVALLRSRSPRNTWVQLFTFRAIMPHHSDVSVLNQPERLEWLKLQSMHCTPSRKFMPVTHTGSDAVKAWKLRDALQSSRESWEYLLDGVVWRDNEGRLTKIKFDACAAVTEVIEIVEQLGRTGIVSFVIRFEPITLAGATIRRATGFNAALIGERFAGIGVGAKVIVSRRGDVIPQVESVVEAAEHAWAPSMTCPSCGANASWDGSYIKCDADPFECTGTTAGLLRKFVMDRGIKGFGLSRIAALVENGIDTPAALYTLSEEWLEALQVSGRVLGWKEAERMVRSVQAQAEMSWGELLGSVGVPGCATSVMSDVARVFPDPDALITADIDDLSAVNGIGPKRASSIAAFLDTKWSTVVQPLIDVVSIRNTNGPLSGLVFCITLALRRPRPVVESDIRKAGGDVKSSVSRKVTHVVCEFPHEKTAKLKQARELGLPIISGDELYNMIGVEEIGTSVDDSAAPATSAF